MEIGPRFIRVLTFLTFAVHGSAGVAVLWSGLRELLRSWSERRQRGEAAEDLAQPPSSRTQTRKQATALLVCLEMAARGLGPFDR